MILIINFVALYASFSLNHMLAIYWGAVPPVLYALVVAPHALIGRSDIPRLTITKVLAVKWNNAEELTTYIVKYWMALAYPVTSWKKQRNSIVLSLSSFFLGVVYILKELVAAGVVMFVVGYVLYQMSLRVDRPRAVYGNSDFRDGTDNEFARKEWELAAMSIIAFSELYPDDKAFKKAADEVLEDNDVKSMLTKYRYDYGASWMNVA